MAAFGLTMKKTRTILLAAHLPLLIIMFGILFTMSLLKLGPAKHDEDLRRDLTGLVQNIARKTREDNKLPDSIDSMTTNRAITYKKMSDKKYQVCANFQTSGQSNSSYYYGYDGAYMQNDDYVSESRFYVASRGDHCFEFTSTYLEEKEADTSQEEVQYY